jgi:D-serine deaminase-like pyridoxal phosphate-dependent protein
MSYHPPLQSLRTPAVLVDDEVLRRNARAMAERTARLGVRLRPHVKTHKCPEAARIQVEGRFGGVTVSTLAEARHFARHGFRDVTYAVPIAPRRLPEAVDLAGELDALHLLVDSPAAVASAQAVAAEKDRRLSVLLKVDCGYHRAGVDPEDPAAVELARAVAAASHLELQGVLSHGGHAYDCHDRTEILAVAEEERRVTAAFAEALRREGIPVPVVSIGSTPTLAVAEELEAGLAGITEVRPGNYLFFDLYQAAIGSCRLEDLALSVLTTVIGCYPERGTLLVDAGALALSKDPGAVHVSPERLYGRLVPEERGPVLEELRLVSLSQEHGKILCSRQAALRFPVGTRLRVLPNHSCLVAALFEEIHVVRRGRPIDVWRPARGW